MARPLLLVATTAFLLMLGLGVLFPVLPYFTRSLALSDVEAGLLMSAYPAIGVLVSPAWGRFSERRGRKLAIVIGLLPPAFWARYTQVYQRGVLQGGSLLVAGVATVWLLERSLNLDVRLF